MNKDFEQIGRDLDAIQHEVSKAYVKLNGCNRTSVQTLLSTARQKILIARAVLLSMTDKENKPLLPTMDDALAARLGSIALQAGDLNQPGMSHHQPQDASALVYRGRVLRALLEDENLSLVDMSQPTPSYIE